METPLDSEATDFVADSSSTLATAGCEPTSLPSSEALAPNTTDTNHQVAFGPARSIPRQVPSARSGTPSPQGIGTTSTSSNTTSQRDINHTADCPICLEPLYLYTILEPCGHIFHDLCINRWIYSSYRTSGTCPVCRGIIYGTTWSDRDEGIRRYYSMHVPPAPPLPPRPRRAPPGWIGNPVVGLAYDPTFFGQFVLPRSHRRR